MEDGPLRWGILAPGNIANRFAQAFEVVEHGVLFGVASRELSRAEEFAKQYNIPNTYDSYQALIDSDDIDVVYIASPHRFHFQLIKSCLLAGKPVLCEKPLCVTAKEAAELIELSKKTKTFLMEALWTRCLPVWHEVKKWIDDGRIGDVVTMQSSFGFVFPDDPNNRLYNLNLAGGALLDTGIYNIAMSDFVMQKAPLAVHSAVEKSVTDVDKRTTGLLDYGSATSSFTCTLVSELSNSFAIYGTQGSIVVDANFWEGQGAQLNPLGGDSLVSDLPYRKNGFEYQIDEVHKCLQTGKLESPNVSHEFTLRTAKIMDKILTDGGVDYPFSPRS
jgi:predicted dehydrogenase